VALRKSGNSDIEVVAIFCSDILDEVDGFAEPSGSRSPVGLSIRRISSKCENILTAMLLGNLLG
jgi:hypothetical protein